MNVARRVAAMLPRSVVEKLNRARWHHPRLDRLVRPVAARVASGEAVIASGPAAGLRIDATGRNAGYTLGTSDYEEQLWLAANLRPGNAFWDVGANIGFFTLLAARLVGEAGEVTAFEPWPTNFEQLQRNISLNRFQNVQAIASALGATDGVEGFALPDDRRDAGRLTAESDADVTVAVTTIDSHVRAGNRVPDVIKLDIEGAEIEALRGGLQTLAVAKPLLLIEVHWLGSAFRDFLEQQLMPLGYAVESLAGETFSVPAQRRYFHVALRPPR